MRALFWRTKVCSVPALRTLTADDRTAVTIFRFCRRARFSVPAALKLLHATLAWRLSSLSLPATLDPLYATQPLFFFHPSLSDKFGRPCAVLNLRLVSRTEDGELEALKEFVRVGWEVGRRWLSDLSAEKGGDGDEVKVQMVVIVDLEGAGMSNLVRGAAAVRQRGADPSLDYRKSSFSRSSWTC